MKTAEQETAFDIGERVQVYDDAGAYQDVGIVEGIRTDHGADLYTVRADEGAIYNGISEMNLEPEDLREAVSESKTEVDRLREAIEAHRDRWQSVNGSRPESCLPSDLELWKVLDVPRPL